MGEQMSKTKKVKGRQAKFTDYDGFVEKFDVKRTTDDCYTPKEIFDAIADHVCKQYGVDPASIVRPFWPGGDFEAFDYPDRCVVLDNPPFSIITRIVRTYNASGIRYFLFAPHLTLSGIPCPTAIVAGVDITYENGATVKTSFATNLPDDYAVRNDVELFARVRELNAKLRKERVTNRLMRVYDPHIFKYTDMDQLTRGNIQHGIKRDECMKVNGVGGTDSFGKWLLLSTNAMQEAERARAEAERARAEAERARAERVNLGPQELLVIQSLDAGCVLHEVLSSDGT